MTLMNPLEVEGKVQLQIDTSRLLAMLDVQPPHNLYFYPETGQLDKSPKNITGYLSYRKFFKLQQYDEEQHQSEEN